MLRRIPSLDSEDLWSMDMEFRVQGPIVRLDYDPGTAGELQISMTGSFPTRV